MANILCFPCHALARILDPPDDRGKVCCFSLAEFVIFINILEMLLAGLALAGAFSSWIQAGLSITTIFFMIARLVSSSFMIYGALRTEPRPLFIGYMIAKVLFVLELVAMALSVIMIIVLTIIFPFSLTLMMITLVVGLVNLAIDIAIAYYTFIAAASSLRVLAVGGSGYERKSYREIMAESPIGQQDANFNAVP